MNERFVPIAIVGMACRLPGADSLDAFWDLVIRNECALGELPESRLNRELYYHPEIARVGKTYSSLGGLVSNRPFDRTRCPLPEDVIETSDPAHLVLCEVAAEACRHAGWDPFRFPNPRAGVYIGHTGGSAIAGDYTFGTMCDEATRLLGQTKHFSELGAKGPTAIQEIIQDIRARYPARQYGKRAPLGAYPAAEIISRAFGLKGPNLVVDAACASSLQALAIGVRALQQGSVDVALAGGASYCKSDSLVLFSQAQSVSANGSCPFGAQADGLIAAEGYVVLVLKTLDKAVLDGDKVQAVIRGMGVSTDGKGKSLWAPRKEGQILAVQRAYGPDVEAKRLQYIEAHATSTQVGDATELQALATALSDRIPAGMKIPVGSVKANVGHTLETAGMAGLLKTVLAIHRRRIPPALKSGELNETVDWSQLPFLVPRESLDWPEPADGQCRRAAVNAFGIGGLNVHVVLDEYRERDRALTVHPRQPAVAADEGYAVIGMGTILPGAFTIDAMWDLLLSGRDPKCEVPADRWNVNLAYDADGTPRTGRTCSKLGAFIQGYAYDWKKHKIPPKQIQNANPLQFMLLDAADQALRDGGYDRKTFDRTRTGVVVGTMFGGDFTNHLQVGLHLPEFEKLFHQFLGKQGASPALVKTLFDEFREILLARMPALLDETGSFTSSTLASRISKTFDLMGGALAIDAGGCSALAAIDAALGILREGTCEMVVCAAGQRSMDLPQYESVALKDLLARGEPKAGFEVGADGFVPGEGAGVILLKRLSTARRDGDRIRAVIRNVAGAFGNDLREAMGLSIRQALSHTMDPSLVSTVESSSFACLDTDRQELGAIESTYAAGSRRQPILLSHHLAQFGESGALSGMTGVITQVLAVEKGIAPRSFGCGQPIEELAALRDRIQIVPEPTTLPAAPNGYVAAAVNSFQDSLAYHLVLDNGREAPKTAASNGSSTASNGHPVARQATNGSHVRALRIVRVEAASLAELRSELSKLAGEDLESVLAQAFSRKFQLATGARAALVVDGPDSLKTKLRLAADRAADPAARNMLADQGIFVGEVRGKKPRVAFLFPGQGSQYPGMLRELIEISPRAATARKQVDRAAASLGFESFSDIAWQNGDRLGSDVWITQLSMLMADLICLEAVRSLGIVPDVVAGHSYGEFPALYAAGVWSPEEAVQVTRFRCQAIQEGYRGQGGLLSIAASRDQVDGLIKRHRAPVSISVENGPQQIVVAGERSDLGPFADKLAQEQIKSKVLSVPCPFHSPMMRGVRDRFATLLEQVSVAPPSTLFMSTTTARYMADPSEIRATLAAQMTDRVRFAEVIERLAADGVEVFVEVGPQQVLTQLARRILADRPIVLAGVDHANRSAAESQMRLEAAMECCGVLNETSRTRSEEVAPASKKAAPRTTGAVAEFDATQPRRERMRAKATQGKSSPARVTAAAPEPVLSVRLSPDPLAVRAAPRVAVAAAPQKQAVVHPSASPVELPESRRSVERPAPARPPVEPPAAAPRTSRPTPAAPVATPHALELSGDPHAIGLALGKARSSVIMSLLKRRADQLSPMASAQDPSAHLLAEELAELRGVAEGAGVPLANILSLLKTSDQDATSIDLDYRGAGSAVDLHWSHGEVRPEDLIAIRRPTQGLACLVAALPGQVGAAWGINSAGLVVSALSPSHAGSEVGVPPAILVTRLLQACNSTESAQKLAEQCVGSAQCWVTIVDRDHLSMNCLEWHDGRWHAGDHSAGVISSTVQPAKPAMYPLPGQTAWHARVSRETLDRVRLVLSALGTSEQSMAFSLESLLPGFDGDAKHAGVPAVAMPDYLKGDAKEPITQRFVLRAVPAQAPAGGTEPWSGHTVLLGDNPDAQALAAELSSSGVRVSLLAVEGLDGTLAAFEKLWQTEPVRNLILMTARDRLPANRRERGLLVPFFVAQRWLDKLRQGGLAQGAKLSAVTALGGDFGLAGEISLIEGGGLAGLLKGVANEAPELRVKILDFDACESSVLAASVRRELASADPEREVGYRKGQRLVVRSVAKPVEKLPRSGRIASGETWLITGGARGVTAVVARELGKRFGVKLHLIGSTRPAEIDKSWLNLSADGLKQLKQQTMIAARQQGGNPLAEWGKIEKSLEISRNLAKLAEQGIRAVYHTCDITDRAALTKLVESIRESSGPIHGVIHGAGVEHAARFERKKRETVEATIAAKVDGATNLIAVTRKDPLRYFVAFGSTSGRMGGVGQADYSLANDLLAKQIDQFRHDRPECRSVTFHWHAWDEVGMASRPESRFALESFQLKFMPLSEGVAHLVNELISDAGEPEVLITESRFVANQLAEESIPVAVRESASNGSAVSPLVESLNKLASGEFEATSRFDPVRDIFLREHLVNGRPLLPAVVGMELRVQAALAASPGRSMGSLKNVEILNGLNFLNEIPRETRTLLTPAPGGMQCQISADFRNRQGAVVEAARVQMQGFVEWECKDPVPTAPPPGEPTLYWYTFVYQDRAPVYHGRVFRTIKSIFCNREGGWAMLRCPAPEDLAGHRGAKGWNLPSALLDGCLMGCGTYSYVMCEGRVEIPRSIASLRILRMPRPGEECAMRMYYREQDDQHTTYDFNVFGAADELIMRVEGCRLVRLTGKTK